MHTSLTTCRCVCAGLKQHYAVELEVRDGVVFARSKPDIDPATKWSRAKQFFPPVLRAQTRAHDPHVAPDTCPLQDWLNFDKVKKSLTNFYAGKMRVNVTHIPEEVRDGMLKFLDEADGLVAVAPPWVDWERNPHRQLAPLPEPERQPAVPVEPVPEYVPIGHHKVNPDGKICRCGSNTHMQVSSHSCPLNFSRWDDDDESRLQARVACLGCDCCLRWYSFTCVCVCCSCSCTWTVVFGGGTNVTTARAASTTRR